LTALGCQEHKITSFNSTPEASISEPSPTGELIENVEFELIGQVSDDDEAPDSLTTTWRIGTRDACTEVTPSADGMTQCNVVMSRDDYERESLEDEFGEVKVSLTVRDSRNASATVHTLARALPNKPPVVEIVSPSVDSDGLPQRFYEGDNILLEGTVADPEDPDGSDLRLTWESSIDGTLDVGIELELNEADDVVQIRGDTTLSQGDHILTLTAVDLGEAQGSAQVAVEVTGPNETPECDIGAPADDAVFNEDDVVAFSGTSSDYNEVGDFSVLTAQWHSSRNGVINSDHPDLDGRMGFETTELLPGDHLISLLVTDNGGLSCEDTVSISIRANPQIIETEPADGTIYTEGTPITLVARVSDTETPENELQVSWESLADGYLGSTAADAFGHASLEIDDLSAGTQAITVSVIDTDGMMASDTQTLIINQPPTTPSISLSPTPSTTTDDLSATIDIESIDPEGEPISYNFEWYVDDTLSLVSTTDVLPSSTTRKGEVWSIRVTPNDGITDGPSGSASIEIQNSVPSIGAVTISPSEPLSTDTLVCTATGLNDDDEDTIGLTTVWIIDGIPGAPGSATLTPAEFSPGDFVACSVTPNDDESTGETVTADAVHVNVPPVVHSVTVSPENPTVADTVHCIVGPTTDTDGDPVTPFIRWFIDDVDVGATTDSLDSSWFARDDVIYCSVTPNDGHEDGETLSASPVTVENAIPTVTEVSVTPTTATTLTVLTATASGNDADFDTLTFNYQWTVNGVPIADVGSALDGALHFDKDDTVGLSVTANDGFTESDPVAADPIWVLNTPPTSPTVAISPIEAAAAVDDLVCSMEEGASDDDLDSVSYSMTWTRDGEPFTATVDTHEPGDTIPGHVTDAGENWTCHITPNDGTDDGPTGTSTVVPEWRFSGWGDAPFPLVDADAHLLGTNNLAEAGTSVSAAGDIDGDGMIDILVGAPQDDTAASNSGRAYLVLSSHFVGSDTVLLSDAHRIYQGSEATGRLGYAVEGGVNFGGGPEPDVIIGAYSEDSFEPDDGTVGVFWDGGPASSGPLTMADADVILHGGTDRELAGQALALLDDMDDDGLDELLIGAPHSSLGGSRSGVAYLVLGSTLTTGGVIDLGDERRYYGESGLDKAGQQVRSAGDVDGDGVTDLMVAAPENEAGGAKAGRVYIIYGVDALTYPSLILGDADIRIHGESPHDYAGLGISNGRDVDGDGSPEIILGAPENDAGGDESGRAYLFWGSGLGSSETKVASEADVIFTASEEDGELGLSVSADSDVDADGMHDVIIGVPYSHEGGTDAGAALLFMGEHLSAGGVFSPSDADYNFYGTGSMDHAGYVVKGMGDIDGDGFGDLAVTEPDDTTIYGVSSGSVHLLFAP